ncbi:MAG: elongation factor 1-beta [Candidatus Altiarchaeota archaeon]|nr:elongation factor 1-beta [Candidatus Altiarchaeota archaeon]
MELNVAATVRIMPEGTDVDYDSMEKGVRAIVEKYGKVHSVEIKPIAFGLRSLEVVMLLSDSVGGIDEIESEVGKLSGVASVETTDVNRL